MTIPNPCLWQRDDIFFASGASRCAAWLYRPQLAGPLPCIVLGHGFGGLRQMLAPYAEAFAAAGFVALAIDYRNFGASEGMPRQVVKIKNQLEDLTAALDYVSSLEAVASEYIGIWGSSLGGGHAITMASRDPRIRAAVAQVPHIDGLAATKAMGLKQIFRILPETIADFAARLTGSAPTYVELLGSPGAKAIMTADASAKFLAHMQLLDSTMRTDTAASSGLEVAAYAPKNSISKVTCPLLMLVADHDGTAPADVALKAAKRASNCEVIRYPVQHFDVYLEPVLSSAISAQIAFFQQHLLEEKRLKASSPLFAS